MSFGVLKKIVLCCVVLCCEPYFFYPEASQKLHYSWSILVLVGFLILCSFDDFEGFEVVNSRKMWCSRLR